MGQAWDLAPHLTVMLTLGPRRPMSPKQAWDLAPHLTVMLTLRMGSTWTPWLMVCLHTLMLCHGTMPKFAHRKVWTRGLRATRLKMWTLLHLCRGTRWDPMM